MGFGVMLFLVRLLEPEAYGQFALVTAIVGFLNVFSHQTFIAYTLQSRSDEDVHYQVHFTASGAIQTVMFILTNVIAVALRFTENYSAVSMFVHVMSVGFILEWPCELYRKMLERSLNWRRLRSLHAVGLVVSSLVAISMGYLDAGAYALLVPGLIVTLPFLYDLFVIRHWRPTWEWNKERYLPAIRFAFSRIASGVVSRSRKLLESGALVYVLGFAAAGLFERAIALGLMFCQRVATQIMYSLYPIITKLEPGTPRFGRVSGIILRGVAWFSIPMSVLMASLAGPIVRVVYGAKWIEVIQFVPIAAALGAVGAVLYTAYMLLLAHKEERRCLDADIIAFIGTVPAVLFLLPKGLGTYLIGLSAIYAIALGYTVHCLFDCGAMERRQLVNAICPPMLCAGLAYAVCQGITVAGDLYAENWKFGGSYGIGFSVFYLFFLRFLFTQPFKELVDYLPGRKVIGRVLLV